MPRARTNAARVCSATWTWRLGYLRIIRCGRSGFWWTRPWAALSGDFAVLYSTTGRPSIAPEKLLRALLLQAFYTIRSERQLMEQLDYNLLFRWFVGLSMDAPVWDATTYSKNRDRLVCGGCGGALSSSGAARRAGTPSFVGRALLGRRHADRGVWASMKSFRRKDDGGDPPAGRATRSVTSAASGARTRPMRPPPMPMPQLFRKGEGQSSRLCFMGHLLMENRNALIVDAALTRASGTAEREAALAMLGRRKKARRVHAGRRQGL